MARTSTTLADPSSDAASVLRRLGFGLLFFATPLAALFARRSVVVLAPVAIILLVLAAALDGASKHSAPRLRRLPLSAGGLAGLLLLFWIALSLIWTPFVSEATDRLLNIVGMLAMALVGYAALPDRMRSANLYILPVGIALTAVAAIGLSFRGIPANDPDGQNLERGLTVLVLFLWPGLTWLHSRGRNVQALLLALAVALAAMLAPDTLPLQGLVAGALVFAITAMNAKFGIRFTAIVTAGLLLLAPVLPFILKPMATTLFGAMDPLSIEMGIWRRVVSSEPLRLLTGHGLETALRGRFVGLVPTGAPSSILFDIWYELGLVGAAAGAAILYHSIKGSAGDRPVLTPGIMATFASAFAFACLGVGTTLAWWFTALVVVVLIFEAIERGQFRTKRPKAAILRRGLQASA